METACHTDIRTSKAESIGIAGYLCSPLSAHSDIGLSPIFAPSDIRLSPISAPSDIGLSPISAPTDIGLSPISDHSDPMLSLRFRINISSVMRYLMQDIQNIKLLWGI
jgi:hypothetical protein